MSWMIFDTIEDAQTFISECDALLGLPKSIVEGKQIIETWAKPDLQFIDNKIGVPIPDGLEDYKFTPAGTKYTSVSELRPPESEN